MTDQGAKAAVAIAFLILQYAWLALCLGTCTYLVFWRGFSGWWFLLAVILCASGSSSDENKS